MVPDNQQESLMEEMLEKCADDVNIKNTITIRSSEWKELKSKQTKGLIDDQNYRVQVRNINDALLKCIDFCNLPAPFTH